MLVPESNCLLVLKQSSPSEVKGIDVVDKRIPQICLFTLILPVDFV